MIGKKELILNAEDFVKGMSSSDYVSDGGFSNLSTAVNLTYNPGVLYWPAQVTNADPDSRLTGNIIASSTDDDVFLGYERKMVTDDGKYYRYNGTKIPEAALRTDAVNTYAKGFTDMISFAGESYITTKEKLVRWDETGAVFNASFFSFANTTYPHPATVFENNAYYGDKNVLLQQTSAGGTPTAILTLSVDQVIVSLGIDEGTGLMLISTTDSLNMNTTLSAVNKIHWYDGNSAKSTKTVRVDECILSFHSASGVTLVGYGQNIGYMNGSGISWLRKLKNVTLSSTELPYKHNWASIGNTVYVADGKQILAYGEVLRGRKVFYYAQSNVVNSNKYTALFPVGSGKLGFGFATTKFYVFDTTSVSSTEVTDFYTNKYMFPRPVYIRGIFFEFGASLSNNNIVFTISSLNQNQEAGFVSIGDGNVQNVTGTSTAVLDSVIGMPKNKLRSIQFKFSVTGLNYGLVRMIVYYGPAE